MRTAFRCTWHGVEGQLVFLFSVFILQMTVGTVCPTEDTTTITVIFTIKFHDLASLSSSSFSHYIPNTGSRTKPEVSVLPANCLKEVIESVTLNPLCYPNSYCPGL